MIKSSMRILLLRFVIVVGLFGKGEVVDAQNILDGDSSDSNRPADIIGEQVLYSNPQWYTLSEQLVEDGTDAPPEKATPVHGMLFNIRSKLDGDDSETTIHITGFEFYTSIAGMVYYELRSREGEYYDHEDGIDGGRGIGSWESFDLISGGLADGSGECTQIMKDYRISAEMGADAGSSLFDSDGGNPISQSWVVDNLSSCPLTIVPKREFVTSKNGVPTYPLTLKGANSTLAVYITLASSHLLASPGTSGGSPDSTVVASTPDIEIYDGVGARTYPLHHNQSDFYFEAPMGFIGKVHYYVEVPKERMPSSMPSTEPSTSSSTEPSTSSPTALFQPSIAPTSSMAPTYEGATGSPQISTSFPTASPTIIIVPATSSPTAKPTKRCRPGRPCISAPPPPEPTTSPSASSPVDLTIELMVYVENVPNRILSERENEEYVETITDFLRDNKNLKRSGVSTISIENFYHNVFEVEEDRRGRGRGNGMRGDPPSNGQNASDSFSYHYNTKSSFKPKVDPAITTGIIYSMTKVHVRTMLPYEVTAFFLWEELTVHEMAIIQMFKSKALFVSYFRDMTNITFEVVYGLSASPTVAPTIFKPASVMKSEEDEQAKQERRNLYAAVGIGLGAVWFLLTACSIHQIAKHRKEAIEHKELTRQQKLTRRQSSLLLGRRSTPMSLLRRMLTLEFWIGPAPKKHNYMEAAMEGARDEESNEDSSTAGETRPSQHTRKKRVSSSSFSFT